MALLFIFFIAQFPGLLFTAAPAAAEDVTLPAESPPNDQSTICWFDEYHSFMLNKIKNQTVWFDNFFGDRRADESDQPTSYIRLRTVFRYTEGKGLTLPIRLRANMELPHLNRRLRLVIFGGNREEGRQNDPDNPVESSTKTGSEEGWTNLGLRYMLYKSFRERFHFGGGLSVGWPLEYYGLIGYDRVLHNGSDNTIRFTETGFWNSLIGFGETSRIDLEKTLHEKLTGRLSFFGTFAQDKPGMQWGVETSLFRQLSEGSALALDLGAYGLTQPYTMVETYRIGSRYRRNFLRPWLFLEVEPEVSFPLSATKEREAVGALTAVLEVQFINK